MVAEYSPSSWVVKGHEEIVKFWGFAIAEVEESLRGEYVAVGIAETVGGTALPNGSRSCSWSSKSSSCEDRENESKQHVRFLLKGMYGSRLEKTG